MELQPKIIKDGLLKMEGISSNQIVQHYDILYKGYVNKTNEINKKLILAERDKANQTYSELRELKVELSFALNGVKLHEAYFDNLAGAGTVIDEGLKAETDKGLWFL
jgi:Fe-Mn family superoxide dismutase